MVRTNQQSEGLSVAGLFAGIGGIELGLHASGHHTELVNEIWEPARTVLESHFGGVDLIPDVRDIERLPKVDLVSAGFPCQDLSQAGGTAGISGSNSGLVGEVFRLIEPDNAPEWLLLENVPFMLRLDRGEAMTFLTTTLDSMGYAWAYRVVDTRAFGLPQRRKRVLLLASRVHDPREVLFVGSEEPREADPDDQTAFGFYWTEGLRGLGWGISCVPTLKGGSGLGIPSPPAIWMPDGSLVTPDIRDAERLQGFDADWTQPADELPKSRAGNRWKLVGNAVSVPLSTWVGQRLLDPKRYEFAGDDVLQEDDSWPTAAWGIDGKAHRADMSEWPVSMPYVGLADFLEYPVKPLSERAASGFLSRAERSGLRFVESFLDDVAVHIESLREAF
jgi:DNA (cytosine-5)-methyltransferase 1